MFVKGGVGSILLYGSLPLFKFHYGVTSIEYQRYCSIGMVPWGMKPLVGAISDTFPLFGWHKKNYILGAVLVCSICLLVVAANVPVSVAVVMSTLASFCIMTIDLLFEGAYSRIMAYQNGSTSIASFVWGCVMIGTIFGAILVGPLGDSGNILTVFIVAIPLILQLLYPLVRYPLEAIPNDNTKFTNQEFLLDESRKKGDADQQMVTTSEWSLCIVMFLGAIGLIIALFAAPSRPWSVVIFAIILAVFMHTWAYFVYSDKWLFWVCNVYMFLSECLYINITGAQDYFYTADKTCIPDGPNFDLVLYTTTAAVLGGIFGAVGSFIYAKWLSSWSMRTTVQVAAVLRCLSTITDIVIAKRWNITKLGISDKAMFLFGDAMVSPVASMLVLLPMVVMTSKLVDKGHESTTYAVLAGFQNVGQTISRIIGIALMHGFAVNVSADPYTRCNFQGYPSLLVLSHMILPSLCIPLAFVMIPSKFK